ncbi:MAG: peptidase prepilin type [Nocardioidaceae bacterium]|nr:peptidase prepilin type [Nocardioidaceae bacterium]
MIVTPDPLWAGVLCAAVAAVGGLAVPRVIGLLPEPGSDDDAEPQAASVVAAEPVPGAPPPPAAPAPADPPDPDKVPYAELARAPRLGLWCALVAAVAAGVMGASRGWQPDLPVWTFLAVAGVAMGYVDWRTRLLPVRLVVPSYVVVGLLLLCAFAVERDTDQLVGALLAWAGVFAVFFVLWFIYPRGLGYGDVRLSGLIGMALGWLGWSAVLVGTYAGFLLGAVIGGVLALMRVVDRRGYPFGPFMLVGVVLGVLADGSHLPWL